MKTSIPLLFALASLSSVSLSCDSLTCGTGTVEKDGECIAGEPTVTPPCGPGTVWNAGTGQCDPKYCSGEPGDQCGFCPDGTKEVPNEEGVIECIGSSGGLQCGLDKPVNCPQPDPGLFMACGRIFDVETTQPIDAATAAQLKVEFYDATGFALAESPEQRPEPLLRGTIDECGNYQAVGETNGVPPPTFVAVAIDDASAGTDNFVLTGVGVPASAGTRGFVNAFYTKRSTMDLWNATAKADNVAVPNDDFEVAGVILPIYLSPEADSSVFLPGFEDANGEDVGPVAGVSVEVAGQVRPDFDLYFTDTDPKLRRGLSKTPNVTGINGTGFAYTNMVADHSGVGPTGCEWSGALGGNVAGVVFVAERHPVVDGCP